MAATLNNISPAILRWAILRAGYNEEKAVEAFPKLGDWLYEGTLWILVLATTPKGDYSFSYVQG